MANTTALKQSAGLATLRQLSVLGLPEPMLRDTYANVIRRLISCDTITLMLIDGNCNLTEAWVNQSELLPLLGQYLQHFYDSREADAYVPFGKFFRGPSRIDLMHRSSVNFLASEMYNEICRKADFRYLIRCALKNGPIKQGCIVFFRSHQDNDFTAADIRRIAEILPYLTHTLNAPVASQEAANDTESSEGLLICGGNGTIEYIYPQALILLHNAIGMPLNGTTLSDTCYRWAAPLLKALVSEARKLAGGKAGAVPVIERSNRYGRFVMRVWRMYAAAGNSPDLYTVSIRRYIPLTLQLLQNPEVQALPAREKQVCLLLSQGMEVKEVAQRIGITPNTAIAYTRALYQRLGINSRHELSPRLLKPASMVTAADRLTGAAIHK